MNKIYGVFIIVVAVLFASCASVNVKKASPAEYGYGVQMTPGWQIGDSDASVHGLISYTRLGFDGGHDNLYQFGGQVRYALPMNQGGGLWVGGELAYLRFTSVYDEETFFMENPRASGFAIGALAGYRLPIETLPVSGYAGLGLVKFGDFTTGDFATDAGGTGITARLGICIHLLSLLHEKGR